MPLPTDITSLWPGLAASLGSGLLIGLERERRKGQGPDREAAGIRSFSVAALLGALAQLAALALGLPALVLVGAGLVAGLAAIAYWRSPRQDPGLTTELALFTTYLIGVLASQQPALGAGLAVLLALLLASRSQLHRFATRMLSQEELHDGLLLGALVLIGLPLVPAGPQPALGGLDPRALAVLLLLMLGLQAAGHVATRALGPRAGSLLAGLLGGFVSSTATIASLGTRQRHGGLPRAAAVSAAVASAAATWIQAWLLLLAQSRSLAAGMVWSALAGLAVIAAFTVAWQPRRGATPATTATAPAPSTRRQASDDPPVSALAATRQPVLRWREAAVVAAMLAGVSLAVGQALRWLGPQAMVASAALAGLLDAHAPMVALGGLVASGQLAPASALWAVMAALSANAVSRMAVASVAGGWRFAAPVALALGLSQGAAWAVFIWL